MICFFLLFRFCSGSVQDNKYISLLYIEMIMIMKGQRFIVDNRRCLAKQKHFLAYVKLR